MNFLKALLANTSSLLDSGSAAEGLKGSVNTLKDTFVDVMKIVMPIVFSVVLAMGVFFSIKLGIGYAKTETTEKREEAKKRLVGAVVGFGIGVVAAAVFWILFTNDTIAKAIFS